MNLLGTLGGLYRFHRKHEGNKKHVSDWGRHFGPGYIFITLSLSHVKQKNRPCIASVYISVWRYMALTSSLFQFHSSSISDTCWWVPNSLPVCTCLMSFDPHPKSSGLAGSGMEPQEPHLMCPRWAPSAHRSICWATIGWVPAHHGGHDMLLKIYEYIAWNSHHIPSNIDTITLKHNHPSISQKNAWHPTKTATKSSH